MAPNAPLLLLKLFGVDRPGPGHSLQHIRDKIYSFAWSRIRRDDHKLDFVISETGINRNVPERLVFGEDPYGDARSSHMPPPSCHLHLVNKQISKDFARYIYSVNDLEVDVNLKPLHTRDGKLAIDKIAYLLCNPNFKRYTRAVRVRVHFPARYAPADLPGFNQVALDDIALALDDFRSLGHLAIRMVPGQGEPLDYELLVAAFPFYPIRMTNWSIRILNCDAFPYTWDLVDAQKIVLLDRAYDIYQHTGRLAVPILPDHTEMPKAEPDGKHLRKLSNKVRQHNNGSQKKRGRKKRVVEAAKQASSPNDLNIAQSSGLEATVIQPIETGTEEQSLSPKMIHKQTSLGEGSADDQSLDLKDALRRVLRAEHPRPTSMPSPPSSPAQENEVAQIPAHIGSVCPSSNKSSVGKSANNTILPDQAEGKAQPESGPSSPAPNSVALIPLNDDVAGHHLNDVVDAVEDMEGDTAPLPQAKKKRRNKKGKNKKTNLKAVQSSEFHHDTCSVATVAFEVQMGPVEPEHPEPSKDLPLQLEDAPVEPLSPALDKCDISRGTWSTVGDSFALFTPETGPAVFHTRTPQIERYLRQQKRLLAARAETKELQKHAKANKQTRKARQLLLRRGHIAADSPLLRATERPRGNVKKQDNSKSRSPSPKLDEKLAEILIDNYHQLKGRGRKVQGQIRECQRIIEEQRGSIREIELRDDEKSELQYQHSSGSSTPEYRFNFETGNGDDDDSFNYVTQEGPESISVEVSGDEQDEISWTEQIDCHSQSHRPCPRYRSGHSESYRIEPLSPQMTGGQQSAEDDHTALGSSDEEKANHQLDSPVTSLFVPQGAHQDEYQTSHTNIAHTRGRQGLAECNERASQVGGQSGAEVGCSPLICGQLALEESQHGRQGAQRGRRSRHAGGPLNDRANYVMARGSYRGNQCGGRSPSTIACAEQAENPWAKAVQASDKELTAQSVERRITLERDMRSKGTTYTDYATPIQDSYIQLDGERIPVKHQPESIIYGSQSGSLFPSDGSLLVQEALSLGSSGMKILKAENADSV
ncbi:hypothetical protein N0V82_001535 [Gnomoniopsis sp. IMI 355080]|nr:hypothetical protein N0V82_001535 [Gnomoniopsis sp. IMI 355080]